MTYQQETGTALVRLTVLAAAAPDPFCRLLANELLSLCDLLYLSVPKAHTTIRRADHGQFLLPQALEMLNSLINRADQHPDHRELAAELRQIKQRVILKHTATFKEIRTILSGIVASIPSSGVIDE